jgi:non-ribosomal peptide synthetase component F
LPLVVQINNEQSFIDYVISIQSILLQHLTHSFFPSNLIQQYLNNQPLFQTAISYDTINDSNYNIQSAHPLELIPYFHSTNSVPAKFDFDCIYTFNQQSQQLDFTIGYNGNKYIASTFAGITQQYNIMLQHIFQQPNSLLINQIALKHASQRLTSNQNNILPNVSQQSVSNVNVNSSIPAQFQEAVYKSANKIAVRLDKAQLTYSELHARVYSLADHILYTLNIKPGCYIGQCVERSIEMIVGEY